MSVSNLKARGYKEEGESIFQGNFITSLYTARRVEFELKRELVGQKEGQPIWKWKDWQGMFEKNDIYLKIFHPQ